MTFCFDIDDTICDTVYGNYASATVRPHMVDQLKRIHEAGHRIIFLTARGTVTGIDWRELTESQLQAWGILYDELHFGKPDADVFVGDKMINVSEFDQEKQVTL